MKITKESIEDCFQIIEKNGGVNAWQEINKFSTASDHLNENNESSNISTQVIKIIFNVIKIT
jgi:hypothetical protein